MGECNGCGECCKHDICHFAWRKLGIDYREVPCPRLIHKDGRYWCGAVLEGGEMEKAARHWLMIGQGCGQTKEGL